MIPLTIRPIMARKYQYIHDQLKNANRHVLAFEKGFVPIHVQYMMQDEEEKHSRSRPFVDDAVPELVSRQKQQGQRHQNIHQDFYDRFWFHGLFLLILKIESN